MVLSIQAHAIKVENALLCFTLILQQGPFKADISIITGMAQGSIFIAVPAMGMSLELSLIQRRSGPLQFARIVVSGAVERQIFLCRTAYVPALNFSASSCRIGAARDME
jgi:hypothetical protein